MIRPYGGVTTIGGSSQPVFGTTLSAASTASVDRFTGTNRPGTTTPPITLTVASTVGLLQNDQILVGPKANFTAANRNLLDQGLIASIVDATHITVQGLKQNHASGEFVVLDEDASLVQITPVAISAISYIGTDSTVSSTDPSVFDVLQIFSAGSSALTYWHLAPTTATSDSYQTSQYWISGSGTFVARFQQN